MTTEAIAPDHPVIDARDGSPPLTTHPTPGLAFPHQQLTQVAPVDLQNELIDRAATLPHVVVGETCVSVPEARAFILEPDHANGPDVAFQCGTEFAHVHPVWDGSLHLTLPPAVHGAVLAAGWGEPHPISGTMLLFGPRNRRELETVWQILLCSYRYALGEEGR